MDEFDCMKLVAAREDEITKLRAELATFKAAVEHVTENGKTRRSFSTGEWAMVHSERLTDLEIAEESAEFNYEQYQDAAMLLCDEAEKCEALQKELIEVRTCLKWSYQNLYSMADPAMVMRVEEVLKDQTAEWGKHQKPFTEVQLIVLEHQQRKRESMAKEQACTTNE